MSTVFGEGESLLRKIAEQSVSIISRSFKNSHREVRMILSPVCLATSQSYFLTKFHARMTWHYYITDAVGCLTANFQRGSP